jgi:hypothetical protein
MSGESAADPGHNAYVGWWASAIVLVVTFAAATLVWFIFHPW